ncbi:hypothetical protein A2661_01125 [Candidatus Giovannonibacteria bacterium RIFCSPHIGHO2_01_FULL_45_24]|nr:MAG: hypothetical protein A2661_01125 [Candidatus Giovannonibacteria bacterium RIFCSPHIGHO2_01_FULL_45_24]OGN21524.1 MAG: hypothetical protein A2915_03880 [Candidatus Yanofskybacteria bacterium RIFCSPLOWO2_01_FULL_41_34]
MKNKTNKTVTFFELAKGAVAIGTAKARETFGEVKEALKLDLGNVLLSTYQRYRQEGWPEDRAKKMTLELAKGQLESRIEELESQTQTERL